jgi:serine protease
MTFGTSVQPLSAAFQDGFLALNTQNPIAPTSTSDPLQLNGTSSSSAPGALAGNTLLAATNLGTLNGRTSTSGTVSSTDPNDYFQFSLSAFGSVSLSLTGLSSDADLFLIQDINNNGRVDSKDVLARSIRGGSASETINVPGLATGSYFALVQSQGGFTNYQLALTADNAGDSLTDARNLGTLSTNRTMRDFVGAGDPNDFYRFQLTGISDVNVSLTNLSADADLYLVQDVNNNGLVEEDEILDFSDFAGSTSETISLRGLAAGNYSIWVKAYQGDTNYTLNASATAASPGNTLGTAAQLGVLAGQQVVRDSVSTGNPSDFYSVRLDATSSLNLSLSGLSADANLYLIRDFNNNGLIDSGEILDRSELSGTRNETINRSNLTAGNYFIGVGYNSGASFTNYTLTLTADSAGQTYSTARNIGVLNGSRSFSDYVGDGDPIDYYRFRLNEANTVRLDLTGLSADADLYLVQDRNGNGIYDAADDIDSSTRSGTASDSIQYNLAAGTYFVRVEQYEGNTNYTLNLSASAVNGFQIQQGTLGADRFTVNPATGRTIISGNGNVDFGTGARDVLDLSNILSTSVSINYAQLTSGGVAYDAGNGTRMMDAITFGNGNQVLFEGIEEIRFSDRTFNLTVTPNDPFFNQQSSLHMMGIHTAWDFTTGSNNVLIGIEDTGLGATFPGGLIHPDLRSPFTSNNNNYVDEFSNASFSQGTAVQGIISAISNNGVGISGINWNSPVQTIDVLGNDFGDLSLTDATREMINVATSQGRRLVINLSLDVVGSSVSPQLEQLIAQNANNALFVIAAGSDNSSQLSTLASLAQRYDNVMAVGAVWDRTDKNGNPTVPGTRIAYSSANGSNYGTGLTLMAPGEVITTRATPSSSGGANFDYDPSFGVTYAAAANVTGVASLVWSANSNLSAAQIKQILAQTAYDLGAPGYDRTTGSGLVNADAAVRRAIALAQPGIAAQEA